MKQIYKSRALEKHLYARRCLIFEQPERLAGGRFLNLKLHIKKETGAVRVNAPALSAAVTAVSRAHGD